MRSILAQRARRNEEPTPSPNPRQPLSFFDGGGERHTGVADPDGFNPPLNRRRCRPGSCAPALPRSQMSAPTHRSSGTRHQHRTFRHPAFERAALRQVWPGEPRGWSSQTYRPPNRWCRQVLAARSEGAPWQSPQIGIRFGDLQVVAAQTRASLGKIDPLWHSNDTWDRLVTHDPTGGREP